MKLAGYDLVLFKVQGNGFKSLSRMNGKLGSTGTGIQGLSGRGKDGKKQETAPAHQQKESC
jgi:hypothetical protein